MFRVGVEAALIVVIVASFLRRGDRNSPLHCLLIGVGLVVLLWLEYNGLTRADEIGWRQAFSDLLDTVSKLPGKLGL